METVPEKVILDRYNFTDEFKDHVVYEILYEGKDKQEVLKKYDLPSVQTISLWIRNFKKRLEKGIISLPDMTEEEKSNLKAVTKRVKELEKALEQANVFIYGLNSMIDYAENEFEIPIRKKRGTKQL